MKTGKTAVAWLILVLGLFSVQPVRGQGNLNALFQYAIFYNGLMEFTDSATLTINGPVLCNSNIYTGSPSALTFNNFVSCSGNITHPAWAGYTPSEYTGSVIFNGTPSPGYATGMPQLLLPLGASNSVAQIIQLPNASDSPTNPISLQRYYYKSDMVILVSNGVVSVTLKSNMFDPTPLVFSYANNLATNSPTLYSNYLIMSSNWTRFGASNWLTTNATFYDRRQSQTNHVTQIDIGKFGFWIATNTDCQSKWNANNVFNGIIYVANMQTITNAPYMNCVRLTNGQTIPTSAGSLLIPGLTVATINPLYIQGLYNCPSNINVGSTNTTGTQPCSVVCDALTILSPAWQDSASFTGFIPLASSSDTVNTAIIAGNVPSTGSGNSQYSGGVNNLPRLLENWTDDTLWLNTSLVNLFASVIATAQFQFPGVYYMAPTRYFSFDTNFNNVTMLPPGTPLFTNSVGLKSAIINLTNLSQTYTGSSLAPIVQTTPPGLNVTLAYSPGNCGIYFTNATNAGMYLVVATVNDPVYTGTSSNFFYINPAPAIVTMSNLTQIFDGTQKYVSITTVPPGLEIYMTYGQHTIYSDAGDDPIVGVQAGNYPLIATVNDFNYTGSVTNTLVITPAPAMVNLSSLLQTYDGTAKNISASTVPPGLSVGFTYNGSTNAPTNVGSYFVVGTVADNDYQGGVTNTLVVTTPPTANLSGLTLPADGAFQLTFTNAPGATFTMLASSDPTAPLTNWTVLGTVTENPPGHFNFTDLQATNYSQRYYVVRSP